MYSLDIVVERFCKELNNTTDSGFICAEMRNPGLDRNLRAAWDNIRRDGTAFASAAEIEEKIVHLTLKDKKPNIAGMQLADLIATPVGRGVLRLPTKDDEVSRRVVKRKFRRGILGQHRGTAWLCCQVSKQKNERPQDRFAVLKPLSWGPLRSTRQQNPQGSVDFSISDYQYPYQGIRTVKNGV